MASSAEPIWLENICLGHLRSIYAIDDDDKLLSAQYPTRRLGATGRPRVAWIGQDALEGSRRLRLTKAANTARGRSRLWLLAASGAMQAVASQKWW